MKNRYIIFGILIVSWSANARAEQQVEKRVSSNHANGKVEIDIGEGSIQVIGWDKNEVEVTGTIGDRVERLDVRKGKRKVWVRAYLPKDGEAREAELVVYAPHSNDIDVQVFQGPILVSGIEGDIQLETFSGDISVSGPCKRVEAGTVNGDITVDSAKRSAGADKVRAKTVAGAIVIKNVRREVEAQSISGPVTIAGNSLTKVVAKTVSGNVRFDGGLSRLGRLEIDTHSGEFIGVFPADLSAEFDITSYNGVVDNAFNPNAGSNQDFIQGEGDPQAEVKATSFSGNIRVTKQSNGEGATAQAAAGQDKKER
ncbi:MAG: DUF4097 family beta strand repeat-containing protein [Pirellulales bacterium]